MDLTEFREVFFDEVAEHLGIIDRCLHEIGQGRGGADALAEAYRCAHSIKGGSATFGFEEMRDRAGSLAGVLDLARQGRLVLDAAALESCCDAQAALTAQLSARRCGAKTGVPSPVFPPAAADDRVTEDEIGRVEAAVASLRHTAAQMQEMMATMDRLSREHAEVADRAAMTAMQFEHQLRELLDHPALVERSALAGDGVLSSARQRRGEGAPLPKVKAARGGRRSLEQEWEEI